MASFDPVRARRVATHIVASVSAGKRASVVFTILNVSITGAKLEGPLSLALKEKIKIRFQWKGESLELGAEVVRVDSPDLMTDQIAAHFLEMAPETETALQRLVAEMLVLGGNQDEDGDEDTASVIVVDDD